MPRKRTDPGQQMTPLEAELERRVLADYSISLPPPTQWTEVAPAPAEQPLPEPVQDTWEPPPPVDWDAWEKAYDAARPSSVPSRERVQGL